MHYICHLTVNIIAAGAFVFLVVLSVFSTIRDDKDD